MNDPTNPGGNTGRPTPTRLAWRLSYEPDSIRDAYDQREQKQ